MPTYAELDIAVIGAGFSGIAAAVALRESGRRNFAVFERAAEPGGVWRDNVYPGCRCDVPSRLYELDARPNPAWSQNFASQPEILSYLKAIAGEPALTGHFRFNHDLCEAMFDPSIGRWRLAIAGREPITARTIIFALGPLNRPYIPEIPGQETFLGPQFHSARWDAAIDFRGRHVAVIGTGASAVQIVPHIAQQAEKLYVVQRSPPWILPRGERRFTQTESHFAQRFAAFHQLARAYNYWKLEFFGHAYYSKTIAYRLLTHVAAVKRRRDIADPDLRRRLTPADRIGCKRALLSDDYLSSFNSANVKLLDSAVQNIDAQGLTCADGRRADVDTIVWATGFRVTDTKGMPQILNAEGVELAALWSRQGPQAFRGVVVAGFPNLLYLLGPNGGLGHSSAIHFAESQIGYAIKYLDHLDRLTCPKALNLPRDRQNKYNDWVQGALARTTWGTPCNSWYTDKFGFNRAIFPGLCQDYRRLMAHFEPDDFVSNPPQPTVNFDAS